MAQLPSTATIKDIISALQTMEAINQKADLVSVVGSPALSTDDVATIIAKIQNSKNTLAANLVAKGASAVGTESLKSLVDKVNSMPGVKRWAVGTIPARGNESASTVSYSNVNGLTFAPSVVIIRKANNEQANQVAIRNFGSAYDVGISYDEAISSGTWNGTYSTINQFYSDGFQVKNVITGSTSDNIQQINWIAIE